MFEVLIFPGSYLFYADVDVMLRNAGFTENVLFLNEILFFFFFEEQLETFQCLKFCSFGLFQMSDYLCT